MGLSSLFANDVVVVTTKAGDLVRENVQADVQKSLIIIEDISLPIEPGYEISRTLPSGVKETFVVIDPGFQQEFGPIEAHYQIRFRRKDALTSRNSGSVNYHVTGANAKVNIGSFDGSHNVVYHAGSSDELFANIRTAIQEGIIDAQRRESALDAVRGMKEAAGSVGFVECYTRFVSVIADHITLIAPFIPALTQLLSQQ